MVVRFFSKSKEEDGTVEQVYTQVVNGNLWVVTEKNRIYGYVVVGLTKTEYGQVVSIIYQLYLEGKAKTKKVRDLVDKTISAWSADNGAQKILFCTSRNSEAFERLLKNGWAVDSVILSKNLCA